LDIKIVTDFNSYFLWK